MASIQLIDLRDNLSHTIDRVRGQGERVVVKHNRKPVAVLVSVDDYRLLEKMEDEIDRREIRKVRAEGGKPIPLAEVAKSLKIKLKPVGK